MTKRYAKIREIERRVRASIAYNGWVERNKSHSCLCGSTRELELHHVPDLYHIILDWWKIYGNWETVFEHVTIIHESDQCVGVTLCAKCHQKLHPKRPLFEPNKDLFEIAQLWTTVPRMLPAPFCQTQKRQPCTINLVDFQLMFGVGWYILNKQISHRIIQTSVKKLAQLLSKQNSSSWKMSIQRSCKNLISVNCLAGFYISPDNLIEIHVTRNYLHKLVHNPWLFPLDEVKTAKNMLTLSLLWNLRCVGWREYYSIGVDKLAIQLNAHNRPDKLLKRLKIACKAIPWVKNLYMDNKAILRFQLKKRGAVPVHSTRQHLKDAIEGM